jgi:cell division protein ZapE
MLLTDYYQQQCDAGAIQPDPQQLAMLDFFQTVLDDLLAAYKKKNSLLARVQKRKLVTGLYVWGGVGIGKTFLMDCFYQHLPFPEKLRLHFHAFMQYIHHELKMLQGKKDPLQTIAKNLAKKYRVICFDEFVVTDIVDAMLLKNLLQALFSNGVCFVATSNTAPDDLYRNGLQRASFLPAIALLKEHLHVVHSRSQQDYRMLQLRKSGVYFYPDNAEAHAKMEMIFSLLQDDEEVSIDPLQIHGRPIKVIKATSKIAWFNFNEICHVPRSQQDYLQIAKQFSVVFIAHVPVFATDAKNTVALFVRLIDVLYDARTPVIFSAAAASELLGVNLSHVPEYARTQSRLQEMQSEKYFSHHIFSAKMNDV